MINENFALLGALIIIYGEVKYLISTLKGKTKPNKVTWFFWALNPFVAYFAMLDQDVGILSIPTLIIAITASLIFIASLVNKKAYWKITKFDVFCGIFSFLGLILWQITKVGDIAILFSLIADLMAALPTVIKAYTDPDTEDSIAYLLSGIGAGVVLLTVKEWSFSNSAFLIYILLANFIIFSFTKFKLKKVFV